MLQKIAQSNNTIKSKNLTINIDHIDLPYFCNYILYISDIIAAR